MRWIALAFILPAQLFAQSIYLHRLNWAAVPEAVAGYKVYRSFNNAQWLLISNTTNQTVTLTNALSGYFRYRVTAYNSFGESLPSNEAGVDMRVPSSPTNLVLQIIIPVNNP